MICNHLYICLFVCLFVCFKTINLCGSVTSLSVQLKMFEGVLRKKRLVLFNSSFLDSGTRKDAQLSGALNENIVQNHLNIALFNVF